VERISLSLPALLLYAVLAVVFSGRWNTIPTTSTHSYNLP
jgi:hypothetical protein